MFHNDIAKEVAKAEKRYQKSRDRALRDLRRYGGNVAYDPTVTRPALPHSVTPTHDCPGNTLSTPQVTPLDTVTEGVLPVSFDDSGDTVTRYCDVCGGVTDGKSYCGNACKQKAYRQRKAGNR